VEENYDKLVTTVSVPLEIRTEYLQDAGLDKTREYLDRDNGRGRYMSLPKGYSLLKLGLMDL
jgi:hypothetical protein